MVSPAPEAAASGTAHKPDHTLEEYRSPLDVLTERAIGTTARPVRFDWRKSNVGVGVCVSQLDELDDFWSGRLGVFARVPFSGLMCLTWDVEVGGRQILQGGPKAT